MNAKTTRNRANQPQQTQTAAAGGGGGGGRRQPPAQPNRPNNAAAQPPAPPQTRNAGGAPPPPPPPPSPVTDPAAPPVNPPVQPRNPNTAAIAGAILAGLACLIAWGYGSGNSTSIGEIKSTLATKADKADIAQVRNDLAVVDNHVMAGTAKVEELKTITTAGFTAVGTRLADMPTHSDLVALQAQVRSASARPQMASYQPLRLTPGEFNDLRIALSAGGGQQVASLPSRIEVTGNVTLNKR